MSLFRSGGHVVNRAILTARQEWVEQARHLVFGTPPTNNPFRGAGGRSGRKHLIKNLVGPTMVNYYNDPHVRPIADKYVYGDPKKLRWQAKYKLLKATGRGKPKKGAGGKKGKRKRK